MSSAARSEPEITIRTMTEEDINKILAIDKKITAPQRAITYAEPVDNYLGGELAVSCIAEAAGEVVGFILGRLSELKPGSPGRGLIELIGVDPEWQRQGIGTKLVEGFIERCRQRGVNLVHILASVHDEQLRAFLYSTGFRASELVDFRREL
jgi:ribosomal protein S18 acetylase RimI-like enzyme